MSKSSTKNKKAVTMMLETLVGTIISILALYVLLNYLINSGLLTKPTNEQIANSNIQSIKEFIDFSASDEFTTLSNCYTSLKLHNLENFQIEKDQSKTFAYILTKEYIGLISYQNIDILLKSNNKIQNINDLDKYIISKYKISLDNINNLKFDINNDITLNFFKTDIDYYLLFPDFKQNKNKNILEVKGCLITNSIFSQGCNKLIENKNINLVFEPQTKTLFFTKNENSNYIISQNLCSYQTLDKLDKIENYLQYDKTFGFSNLKTNFNTFNQILEILFREQNTQQKHQISFKWDNQMKCFNNQEIVECNLILEDQLLLSKYSYKNAFNKFTNNKNFENFIDLITQYYNNKIDSEYIFEIKIEEKIFDTLLETPLNMDLNKIFNLYPYISTAKTSNLYNYYTSLNSQSNNNYKSIFYIINNWFSNSQINNLKSEESNLMLYQDQEIYFYFNKENDIAQYKKINTNYLRKYIDLEEGTQIFLQNILLKKEDEIKIKNLNKDTKNIYWYSLDYKNQKIDIFISQEQLNNINEIRYNNIELIKNHIKNENN